MERKVQTVQKEITMNTVSFQDRLLQEAMQKKNFATEHIRVSSKGQNECRKKVILVMESPFCCDRN
ncbi:hypothetical protein [Bacillus sp. CDB3]|uniref:hypothetical protein n=1 Tax=Bacillus sp. CDB3 TaxID=360310 RepID=UPI0009D8708A|nr:hypothetical protein [Bacillus sp. CDB3]OQR53386.1 hypothetical protein CDB3_30175 [Bacillus sp. CDB3]